MTAGRTARPDPPHVVLLGMMGAGKTTTGRALADRLGRPFRDCDTDLEARTGRTGAQIAASDGVDHLHHLEEDVLLDALADARPAVITGAGWVVEAERCRDALRDCATVVWLDLPAADLVTRMATSGHRRPMAGADADAVLARRSQRFAELADLHLDATVPTEGLVDAIVAGLSGTIGPTA